MFAYWIGEHQQGSTISDLYESRHDRWLWLLPISEFPFWFKIEPHRFSLYLTLFGKSVCNSHGQQAQTLPILKLYKLPTIGAAGWLIGMQLVVEFIVSSQRRLVRKAGKHESFKRNKRLATFLLKLLELSTTFYISCETFYTLYKFLTVELLFSILCTFFSFFIFKFKP